MPNIRTYHQPASHKHEWSPPIYIKGRMDLITSVFVFEYMAPPYVHCVVEYMAPLYVHCHPDDRNNLFFVCKEVLTYKRLKTRRRSSVCVCSCPV